MRLIVAVALAAVLASPLALAQTEGDTGGQTAGEVMTTQGGPKRVRVPSAEETAAPEPAETESPTVELLPEAEPEPEQAAQPEVETTQATEQAEPAAAETETVVATEVGEGPFVGDYTIGDPDAPVQIVEYASLTCPHCAAFHRDSWPQFKEEYVDTGKVGFTMRDVYFDRFGLWASMTARCAGEAGYYPMVDQFLSKQAEWTRADDVAAAIQQIGRRSGLSSDQLKVCLENQDFAKLLVEEYQANAEADEIRSTPTFVLSGPGGSKTVPGNMSYEDFRALVEEVGTGS